MSVENPYDGSRVNAIDDKVSGILVQVPFFVKINTIVNNVINVFEFDALGCTIREIHITLYIPLHATATMTPTWEKTRSGDLVTFVTESVPAIAGVTPTAATVVRYHCGEVAQGLQGRFRLAQSNHAGVVEIDAFAVVLMEL